jgi:hypothetical protein
MKILKYSTLTALIATFCILFACKKVASPLPEFDSAVHALGKLTVDTFAIKNASAAATYTWRWVSIDGVNTVTKVEYYVSYKDSYTDKDGNSRSSTVGPKLWKVLEGSAAGANRTDITGSITQADAYTLFKDITFNYGLGAGSLPVFSQRGRTATNPFIKSDLVTISWILYTADGRKFANWSPAVCSNILDANGNQLANCTMDIKVK